MSQRFVPTAPTPMSNQLAAAARDVIAAQEKLARLKGVIERGSYGDPPDWAAVGAEFGINAQQAQDLAYLVGQADAYLRVPVIVEFAQRCDMGDDT